MNQTPQANAVTINQLLAIAEDSKFFFESAAKNTDDINIKDSFMRFSHERTFYAQQLKELAKEMGQPEEDYEHTRGPLQQWWMDLKFAISSGMPAAVINAFAECEQKIIRFYDEFLQATYPEDSLYSILQSQVHGIRKSLQMISALASRSSIA